MRNYSNRNFSHGIHPQMRSKQSNKSSLERIKTDIAKCKTKLNAIDLSLAKAKVERSYRTKPRKKKKRGDLDDQTPLDSRR